AMAAEMIDRFGPLPQATANLVKLIEIKHQAIAACIAKIDVGARGTLVSFHQDRFPDPAGLIAYIERLKGTAKLRPDMKLVISRAWSDPQSRLNGLFQLTKGLSGIAGKAEKKAAESAWRIICTTLVFARSEATKQSRAAEQYALDCFAALAMTNVGAWITVGGGLPHAA